MEHGPFIDDLPLKLGVSRRISYVSLPEAMGQQASHLTRFGNSMWPRHRQASLHLV